MLATPAYTNHCTGRIATAAVNAACDFVSVVSSMQMLKHILTQPCVGMCTL
jgi:hypothetical protein